MSFDDDFEPPETDPPTGRSLDEVMSGLADGEGDSKELLAELYDAVAPRLCAYLASRGIAAATRRAALARIAVLEVYRARGRYIDGADVLVWAFAFARQLARAESRVDPSLSGEAFQLAEHGLHAKQIARIVGVSVAEVRDLVARSKQVLEDSLARGVPCFEPDDREARPAVPGYLILDSLGAGGMGCVFKAKDGADATVAIKVMRDHPGDDQRSVDRFLREARMMKKIVHDNIVRVYQAGRLADGRAWYEMEFLEGRTLEKRLEGVRLAWSEVARIVRQVCAGLAAVHAEGIVHCDIKPSNCFLVDDDLVKLLDFGVAQLPRPDGHDSAGGREILGTPDYAAPELINRRCPDARSDIYSIGVMMFRMLTGRLPFESSGPLLMVNKQIAAPAPLSGVDGLAFPRGVERIVQRALATDPADRFQSVEELDAAIAALDGSGRGRLPFARWRRDSTRVTLLAASLSALVASVGTALVFAVSSEVPTTFVPTLGPAHFEAGIASVRGELEACRAEHGDVAAPTAAKLKVLGATGEVIGAELVGPGAVADIGACMSDALFKIRFPRFAEPQREIEGTL